METALQAAKTLNDLYRNKYDKDMEELRMHKLLYFAQKAYLAEYEEPMFPELFQGWRYGPVLPCVRAEYRRDDSFADQLPVSDRNAKRILQQTFEKYDGTSAWDLNSLTHNEFSWRFSRDGLDAKMNGTAEISLDAIRMDILKDRIDEAFDNRPV